jgi:starch-binding outer membrane protein, SusD/RagB family
MDMKIINYKTILFFAVCIIACSCTKFLDKKPNQQLTTPSTLDDLAQLLNDYDRMNANYPASGEISADNYYLLDDGWSGMGNELHENLYLWQKYDDVGSYWTSPYRDIETANVILDNIENVPIKTTVEQQKSMQLRAMALFIRAYYHFALSQLYMPVYNKATANVDLGIPLKLTSDINEKMTRASAQETYDRIIADIKAALPQLPVKPDIKYLPSLPAAFGLLSRVYLSMQDYKEAGIYADSCLKLYSNLIDYNTVDTGSDAPFAQFNEEDIYDTQAGYPSALDHGIAKVDSVLYKSYADNDIRKEAFFSPNGDGTYYFKGNYTGKPDDPTMFTGIATDEMFLTRAECFARQADSLNALKDLNVLLSNRMTEGRFIPYSLPVEGGLLKLILNERRKELPFRELRWTDLRRLNKEPQFKDTLYRYINGKQYILLPGSDRYTLQIDKRSIQISGIEQNP